MATRSGTGDQIPVTIRFTKENHDALTAASAVTMTAVNALVNQAVTSYFTTPTVVASLRSGVQAYASNAVSNAATFQSTIDKLSGKEE